MTMEEQMQVEFDAWWNNSEIIQGYGGLIFNEACRQAWQACQRKNDAEIARMREGFGEKQ
jgi:hypothetical protein